MRMRRGLMPPSEDFVRVPPERRSHTVRRIVGFFRPYRAAVSAVLVAIVVTSLLGLVNPYLLKLLIDVAIAAARLRPAQPVRRADDRGARSSRA